jgi:hypothetical protein
MGSRAKPVVTRILLALMVAAPAVASAHPLHTSLAKISIDGSGRNVSVSVRVFADDFKLAAAASRLSTTDYAIRSVSVRDLHGNLVKLDSCGVVRKGDLLWICLKGRAHSRADRGSVASVILFERFHDQINVVTTELAGKSRNFLFTPGSKPRRIT